MKSKLKMYLGSGLTAVSCLFAMSLSALDVSVKTTGMAATGVAYPQDALASAFNPAGPAEVCDRFDVGLTGLLYHGKARISGNRAPAPGVNGRYNSYTHNWSLSPDAGIIKHFGCDGRFALSLVAYNKSYNKTSYPRPIFIVGTSKPGLEYLQETASGGLAYKLTDNHSIGLTLNYNVQRFRAKGLENFDIARLSSRPGHVTNRNYAYSHGIGVTFGWLGRFSDCVQIGVVYQPRGRMSKFHHFSGLLAGHGRLNVPRKIAAGISVKICSRGTLAFDVEHLQWSKLKSLHNPFQPNFETSKIGLKDGAGFAWRSQTFYRLGVDYDVNQSLTVRAGFRHARTAIPRAQTAVNFLTNETTENYLTMGATWRVTECDEITFFYVHGFNKHLSGHGSIPAVQGGGEFDLNSWRDGIAFSWGHNY